MSCIFFNQFILHKKDTSPPSSQKLIDLEETFEEGGKDHEFSRQFDALEERIQIWNYLYDMEVIQNWSLDGDPKHIEWGPTSTRSSRATASGSTGPKDAHTGSYFVYTEASTSRPSMGAPGAGSGVGRLYKLQSDKFKIDNSSKNMDLSHFTFYYHMYGSGIDDDHLGTGPGHLCVKILKDDGEGGGELSPECVFLKESQQQSSMASAWREGTVPLNNNIMTYDGEDNEGPFVVDGKDFRTWVGQSFIRIIISLKAGGSWRSDIAIDSLKLENIEHDGKSSDGRWIREGAEYIKREEGRPVDGDMGPKPPPPA